MDDFASIMASIGYTPEMNQDEVQETVVEETVVQETAVEETVVGEETQTGAPAEEQNQESQMDFYGEFKNRFGREFNSDDEIKKFFDDYDSLKSNVDNQSEKDSYIQVLENALKETAEQFDPRKQFGSEENWQKHVFKQTIGKGKNLYVADQIANKDLENVPDLDAAAMRVIWNAPGLTKDEGIRAVLKKVGVDFDQYKEDTGKDFDFKNPQLTAEQKVEIAIAAGEAREMFEGLKAGVKYPEFKNPLDNLKERSVTETRSVEDNRKQWGDFAKKIQSERHSIKIPNIGFEFDIDRDFVSKHADLIAKDAVQRGMSLNDESVRDQKELMKMYYSYINMPKILTAYAEDKLAKAKKEWETYIDNGQPINRTTAPVAQRTGQDEVNEAGRTFLQRQGLM